MRNLRTYYFMQHGTSVVRAVDGISFCLDRGESLGVVGESGCGKSTVALSLVRLLPPGARIVDGEIQFDGEELVSKSLGEMRNVRGKIAIIFQDPSACLNPVLSVFEQVGEAFRYQQGLRGMELKKGVISALQEVAIPSPEVRLRQYPHQLSGGTQQRIVGAIAIACRPKLVIADEPTTNLDTITQAQYLALLKNIQRARDLALLFISHSINIVVKMCDRVAVMYAGKMVEQGTTRELLANPRHPYTQALLRAIPRIGQRLPLPIPGRTPSLTAVRPGCSFQPRCSYAVDRCQVEEPPDTQVGKVGSVKCWRPLGGN